MSTNSVDDFFGHVYNDLDVLTCAPWEDMKGLSEEDREAREDLFHHLEAQGWNQYNLYHMLENSPGTMVLVTNRKTGFQGILSWFNAKKLIDEDIASEAEKIHDWTVVSEASEGNSFVLPYFSPFLAADL